MKKIRFLCVILIMTLISQTVVFAKKDDGLYSDNIQMAMCSGGKIALFEKNDTVLEYVPYIESGKLMIPAVYCLENYGYEVSINDGILTAEGENTVTAAAETDKININNEEKSLGVNAKLQGGEMFVPADVLEYIGLVYTVTPNGVLAVFGNGKAEQFDENIFIKLQGVYVDLNGNNNNDGSVTSPVADINAAKKIAVKYMKDYGREYKVRIFVNGGTYRFSSGVSFNENEFSLEGCKGLSIQNFDDDKPEFTGSVLLDPAELSPVTDAKTLARLHPDGRGKVASLDLSKAGIKELVTPNNVFNYIYLNDIEQTNARWPNDHEAVMFSVPQVNSFVFSETDPTKWVDAKDAYVFGHFSKAGWEWHQGIIQSVNPSTKTINIVGANGSEKLQTTAGGTGWYAANLIEEIDSPGEWYVDKENLKLYYYPPYRLKDQKLEIVTCTDTLLSFVNAVNIDIKGVNFSKCYQALKFTGTPKNITIQKCEFSHGQASKMIEFPSGVRTFNINILENKVYNLFGSFIYFKAGNLNTLEDGNCLIKDNYVVQTAQYYKAAGALTGPYQTGNFGNVGVVCEHNVIQDIPGGAAIAYAGTRCRINNNEIINAGKYMSDYGAIYFGRSASYFDTEVAYNFLHDFNDTNNYNGLYNDDAYAGAYWHHNITANMYQPCIQAPGLNTRYMYNIAVNCARTGGLGSRKSYGDSIYYKGSLWTQANTLLTENADVYKKEYPKLYEWLERDKTFFDVCWDSIYFGNIGIGCDSVNEFSEMLEYGAKEMERNGETISIADSNGQRTGNPKYDFSKDIFVDIDKQNYNINPESQPAKDFPELLEIDVAESGLTEDAEYLMETPKTGSHLKYPRNGQKGINASSITFSWDPVIGASFYEITVATDPQLENVVYNSEIRENGNFNQITFTDFANDCLYYWKVTAKGIARQNQFEIDSIGGPYAFKTAVRDTLSKDNLRIAITSYESFCKDDLHNSEYEFDSEFIKMAEDKLEYAKSVYSKARTQKELDAVEQEIYSIVKKSPFFMKLHYENINGIYDKNASWNISSDGEVSVSNDGVLTFSKSPEGRSNAKTAIKNKNSVLCFKMKLADLGDAAGDYQGFDIKLSNDGNGYLIIFKHDIIEWQRIGKTLTEIPNDFIEADKWYDVMAGGINTPNGVLQFFKVDGRVIYAELDQTANQTRDEGWFQIRKNGRGSIQMKNMEEVPADGIIIDDLLDAFKKPNSDKHLQTLFIGSADTVEMSSSELFAKLDKSEIASILYPQLQNREISITRSDVSEYKKLIEEACVIAGYNQGLSEQIFKNKIEFLYNDIINVDSIDDNGVTIYAEYKTMTDKFKASTNETMLKCDCRTIDELRANIAKCMLVGTINACYTGFAGQSGYISDVLTKENADYVGIDISDYLALSPEKKLQANDYIGNNERARGNRTLEELVEDVHTAVTNMR